jgi:hypothetical protein
MAGKCSRIFSGKNFPSSVPAGRYHNKEAPFPDGNSRKRKRFILKIFSAKI